jgi:hypothetical protein
LRSIIETELNEHVDEPARGELRLEDEPSVSRQESPSK